jgi:hypothetical protein
MDTILLILSLLFIPCFASPISGRESVEIRGEVPLSSLPVPRIQHRTASNSPTNNVLHLKRRHTSSSRETRQIAKIAEISSQTAYFAEVTIDDIIFNLFIDTGSSHTWVTPPNNTCFDIFTGKSCDFPTHLSVRKIEKWLAPIASSYIDKSNATGGLTQRPFSIAGITIPHQMIGLADKTFSGIAHGSVDGLLGLGDIGGTGTPSYLPVFSSMVAGGLIAENTFSITLLGTADMDENRDLGLLAFGGIPKGVVPTSKWGRALILTDSSYAIQVDGFKFSGAEDITLSGLQRTVIMDSGTFLTRLPVPVAEAIWDLFPGTPRDKCSGDANEKCTDGLGFWKVPCKGKAPSFSVVIGGVAFPISGENLIVTAGEDYCISGIVKQADDLPGILGVTFMKNVVVVHDFTDLMEPSLEVVTYQFSE